MYVSVCVHVRLLGNEFNTETIFFSSTISKLYNLVHFNHFI